MRVRVSWMCPMHINNIEADQQILFPFYQWAVELCTNKPDMNHRIVIKIQQRPASRRQIFSAMPLSNVQCPYSNIQSINAEVSAAHFISDESCTITLDPSNEFIWSQHAIGFNTVVMYALVNRNKKKNGATPFDISTIQLESIFGPKH